MNHFRLFTMFFVLLGAALWAEEPSRIWRTKSGSEIEAVWDTSSDTGGDEIRLLRNGKKFRVNINKLVEEDFNYVRERRAELAEADFGDFVPEDGEVETDSGLVRSADSAGSDSERGISIEGCNKYALLVGVDDYAKLGKLRYTVDDIKGIEEQLLAMGFEQQNIYKLTSGGGAANRPTKANIDEKLNAVFEKAGPDDLVFLAFTGHGVQPKDTIYFCAEDTVATDEKALVESAVSISGVMSRLSESPARFKWMVIDACRNDPYQRSVLGTSSIQKLDDPPRGSAVMLSCNEKEVSYEDEEFKHGLFSYYLIEGLKGDADANADGAVTLYELAEYTTKMTNARSLSQNNKTQQPYMIQDMTSVILVENASKKQAAALYQEADALYEKGEFKEAFKKIGAALKLDPKNRAYIGLKSQIAEKLPKTNSRPVQGTAAEPDQTVETVVGAFPVGEEAGEKQKLTVNGVDYVFCWCPPGEFTMGSPEEEQGRTDDEKVHRVNLTKGFWILESEVTQQMWQSVTGEERQYYGEKGPDLPACALSWNECREFCEKLSELTHETIQLPTEAQWEYACRADTITPYAGTGYLDDMGWSSGDKYHPVKKKKPNTWGIYDMHGNAREWCADWAGKYDMSDLTDPRGAVGGEQKILRGGSYEAEASRCRSASRFERYPNSQDRDHGFRPVLIPAGV